MKLIRLTLLLSVALAGCTASRPAVELPAPASPPGVEVDTPAPTDAPDVEEDIALAPLLLGEAPPQWFRLDRTDDNVRGVSLDRAYRALAGRTPRREVVVAVIDSGVDLTQDDLEGRIWTNDDEIPGNGLDDDGNGYADDVHGWSFLGGPDGENVFHDTYEMTREVIRLRPRYADADPATLSPAESEEYAYYRELEDELAERRAEYEALLPQMEQIDQATAYAVTVLEPTLGPGPYVADDLAPGIADSPEVQRAKGILSYLRSNGIAPADVKQQRIQVANMLKYGYNPDFDPRPIVGDDYGDPSDRLYGNADVTGPYPNHGTSVAGVIAAIRGNGFGTDGIADSAVVIMPIRAVPSGDERDKDVANAIRYAVDNGALVVNMSFGKSYSPYKSAVDEAVRYAEERGVLLVHAAGNSGEDIDTAANYPTATLGDAGSTVSTRASNWLEVGATTWSADVLAAPFSNYGAASVDLFAPGAEIDVVIPNDATDRVDGTSVAAPVVSGIAALLLSYYPDLSPLDVRDILLESAEPYTGTLVARPGTTERVDFGTLSITGGVVNAARAVELADAHAR